MDNELKDCFRHLLIPDHVIDEMLDGWSAEHIWFFSQLSYRRIIERIISEYAGNKESLDKAERNLNGVLAWLKDSMGFEMPENLTRERRIFPFERDQIKRFREMGIKNPLLGKAFGVHRTTIGKAVK